MSDTTEHQAVIPNFNPFLEEAERGSNTSLRASHNIPIMGAGFAANLKAALSSDYVNHPPHYTGGVIECIDAIEASMSRIEFQGFLKGQVIKYQWRYRQKGGVEDLKKAQWYLAKQIETFDGTPVTK